MSDSLGPLLYGQKEEPIFIGKEIARHKDYSEKTSQMIDDEIRTIVEGAYKQAWDILTKQKRTLDRLAKRLLEKEVLDGKEIQDIMGIKKQGSRKSSKKSVKSTEKTKVDKGKKQEEQEEKEEKIGLPDIRVATNEAGGN